MVRLNGFIVEVKPIPDPDFPAEMNPHPNDPEYMTCHATVRTPRGKVIFERSDWGIEIDPVTGRDVNGDGDPDVVFASFSGGARCCWTYSIISLGKNPGLIGEIQNSARADFKDLNGDGRIEILIRDGGFEEGFGLNHAFSVFPLLIVRLNGEKFDDVGFKFWPVFEKEIREERARVESQNLKDFLHSNPNEISDDLYLETKSRVLMIVLDLLYAGRRKEARKALSDLWPPPSQEQTWAELIGGYCSGLRAQLELELRPPCELSLSQ